jgi:hypothetical protein
MCIKMKLLLLSLIAIAVASPTCLPINDTISAGKFMFWEGPIPDAMLNFLPEIVVTNGEVKLLCVIANYWDDYLDGKTFLIRTDFPNRPFSYLGTQFTSHGGCIVVLRSTNAIEPLYVRGSLCFAQRDTIFTPLTPPTAQFIELGPPFIIIIALIMTGLMIATVCFAMILCIKKVRKLICRSKEESAMHEHSIKNKITLHRIY